MIRSLVPYPAKDSRDMVTASIRTINSHTFLGVTPVIVVLATIELHPGKRNDFLAEFQKIIAPVRAENGCIEYFPAVDHPTNLQNQPPARNDTVVVCEKWESTAALEAHLIAPHMVAYRPRVKEFVKQVSLQILSPAG